MAVTFTNKAAKEMLTRLDAMLAIPVRGMWVGTFHGLCNRFLRAHWKLAALPQGFQILDMADQLAAVKRVVKAMNLDEERHPAEAAGVGDRRCQGRWPAPQGPRGQATSRAASWSRLRGVRGAVPARGRGRLRRADAAHLRAACATTSRCASTTSGASATSSSTSSRTRTGSSTRGSRCSPGRPSTARRSSAVGDDDQSIYAFRGAQVGNMAAIEREYRVRTIDQARAQLPFLRQHPRRRQRADLAQLAPSRQEPAHRGRPGRAGARPRGDVRLRRGAVVHRGSADAAPRGDAAPRDRAPLPQQRAKPRHGERALQRRTSRTRSTGASASSSAPRSSTRSRTCA